LARLLDYETLPEVVEVKDEMLNVNVKEQGNISRTIVMDAERTFSTEEFKAKHIRLLRFLVYCQGGEYDQSMGLVCAFFELLVDERTAVQLTLYISRVILGIGYWTVKQPLQMAADGWALHKLFLRPEIAAKLRANHVFPNMYLQKWWKALMVDSLPFPVVVEFINHLFLHGQPFLFQMAVKLHEHLSEKVLEAPGAPAILDLLYLKHELKPTPNSPPSITGELWNKAATLDIAEQLLEYPSVRLSSYYSEIHKGYLATKNMQDDDDDDDFDDEDEED
jgi:hypothetical protein